MKQRFFHRRRSLAASLCAVVLALCSSLPLSAQSNIFPPSGFAGIGTTGPAAPLHIYEIDGASQYPATLFGYGVDFGGEIGVANADGTPSALVRRGDYFLRTTSRTNHLILAAQRPGGQIKFGTTVDNGTAFLEREALTISAVQDAESQKGHTQLDLKTAAPNEGNAVLRFYTSPDVLPNNFPWMMGMDTHHDLAVTHQIEPLPIFRIGLNSTPSSPTFGNDNFSFLTLLRDGRVIIGKPLDPASGLFGSKLSVDGTIVANELVCIGIENWPDFVFDESYELPSLTEVEEHIREHNHLPNIPSAADVSAKGVSVADMQAKLLQKVEELTLYMIEQNKQITEQNARIQQLEAELAGRVKTGEQR